MTTETFQTWLKQNIVDYKTKIDNDEYKNFEEVNKDLQKILDTLKDETDVERRRKAVAGFNTIKEDFIQPELNDAVEKVNEEKVKAIGRVDTRSKLEIISVSEYLPKTIQIKRQRASAFAVIEREEERKEIFFQDPLSAIEIRGYRRWSAVQSFYELTDEELQRVKDQLGEELLS